MTYPLACHCEDCDQGWYQEIDFQGEDAFLVSCPRCRAEYWQGVAFTQPAHLIISEMNGAIFIKPSRPVPVWRLRNLVTAAERLLNGMATNSVLDPDDCPLRAFLTVDDSQEPAEEDLAED